MTNYEVFRLPEEFSLFPEHDAGPGKKILYRNKKKGGCNNIYISLKKYLNLRS